MGSPPSPTLPPSRGKGVSRRAALLSAFAVAACGRDARSQQSIPARGPEPPLKSLAPFPVGCAVQSDQLADPAYAALFTRHFSQLTPEWEMKMEYILRPDGTFRFDASDRLAAFAKTHNIRLFGHALIWYAQGPAAFERLEGEAFANAYRNYILAVAGRYRGQAVGWDVVNEAVTEDGSALRDCLWGRKLGEFDYIRLAFQYAREADPAAPLFLNDYGLDYNPAKRATFLKLAERLLKAGAPLGGLGTQSHLHADLAPGAYARAIRDLASLGLPIHISELDISLNVRGLNFASRADLEQRQARLYGEAAEAFAALPERQRFAFTVWGLRDSDSWLRREKTPNAGADGPLLFDSAGAAKSTFWAVADAVRS
ncbi:MAG: endo-1,4-beta-xylanase [Caulobacteraceae bacterium]